MRVCAPSNQERAVLSATKQRIGRNWKSVVLRAWATGSYGELADHSPELRTIRNTRGPTWLLRVRID
jgi:hypothetical protein